MRTRNRNKPYGWRLPSVRMLPGAACGVVLLAVLAGCGILGIGSNPRSDYSSLVWTHSGLYGAVWGGSQPDQLMRISDDGTASEIKLADSGCGKIERFYDLAPADVGFSASVKCSSPRQRYQVLLVDPKAGRYSVLGNSNSPLDTISVNATGKAMFASTTSNDECSSVVRVRDDVEPEAGSLRAESGSSDLSLTFGQNPQCPGHIDVERPIVTSDGAHLIVLAAPDSAGQPGPDRNSSHFHLYSFGLGSSAPAKPIGTFSRVSDVALRRDQRTVLIAGTSADGGRGLWSVSLDTGAIQKIRQGDIGLIALAPDERRIVVVTQTKDGGHSLTVSTFS
jgi:hypothetical protein